MSKKLFLLDGMALIYRAHFAFATRPIMTSQGVNTSALYGFTNTVLDIIKTQKPTHLAVAFDTPEPTQRHVEYPEYKAQREEIPEDIVAAIPNVFRLCEALNIPVLKKPGYEADDIVGTITRVADDNGFQTYMVTPDKDFGQLVSDRTFLYRPARTGSEIEIMGVPEVLEKWQIQRIDQVIDMLGLCGDSVDNIPGVPGIGPKTAQKLLAEFGTVEGVLENTDKLKGKQKEKVEANRERALLSKRLATILRDVPVESDLDALELGDPNHESLKALCIEFEFNSIGRRLFSEDFKAGRGGGVVSKKTSAPPKKKDDSESTESGTQELLGISADLKTIKDVSHDYQLVDSAQARKKLIKTLSRQKSICFDTETTGLDPKTAAVIGLAFSFVAHTGYYVPVNEENAALEEFRAIFESEEIEKVGHNLKFDLSILRWGGIKVRGKLFDTMLAHSLTDPDQRHGMDFLSEVFLAYTPVSITTLIGDKDGEQGNMAEVPLDQLCEYAAEDADVTWQLSEILRPLLKEKDQEKVYYEVEAPLIPALVEMEFEGVLLDSEALGEFSTQLGSQIAKLESKIFGLAGTEFNLNSPKQLGEVLFDKLKLVDKPKKTRTGQYATNEQTLIALSADHEIVRNILDYRTATKLKSTYTDTLPHTIFEKTGRVHTTYHQAATATGRLNSHGPNLQNIPIRTDLGQEIRRSFVAKGKGYTLLSADYSQIELRIIAALSKDTAMLEAFESGMDTHTATASKVYGVPPAEVIPEMRRKAKMVNFGIAYGISAFGLAQRLGIPRREASEIIDQYFLNYPGIQSYMDETKEFARKNGYVETVTGRRRYLRDINSANGTVRGAAERNAINAPIQGTAADMIKIAMANIHLAIEAQGLKSRMLLQVHDELVFDLFKREEDDVKALVEDKMRNAIPLAVPIVIEMGTGANWLEAH